MEFDRHLTRWCSGSAGVEPPRVRRRKQRKHGDWDPKVATDHPVLSLTAQLKHRASVDGSFDAKQRQGGRPLAFRPHCYFPSGATLLC